MGTERNVAPEPQHVLKLARDEQSEERELDFELDFQQSLSVAQRFALMFERSRLMAEMLRAHGHGEPSSVLKRM
jgi:hypothetical protein